jgi:hypothetical protein
MDAMAERFDEATRVTVASKQAQRRLALPRTQPGRP